jgi:hypothetical protein
MIDIKTERNFYSYAKENISSSLDYAKSLQETDLKRDLHFYWRVPREFSRKQLLPIKSAIVNNKNECNIYLWSNVDLSNNTYIQPLLPYITLKIWDPIKEIEDSFLKDNLSFFKQHKIDDEKCWLGGDLFRLLCLYKYGGIYIDMDMVVLRNLSPLYPYNFLYQWGSSGTTASEPNLMINGAIMSFFAGNENVKCMLETLVRTNPVQNTFCWGRDLYGRTRNDFTHVFPCAWFNTEWGTGIPLEGFKKSEESAKLYEGAFTWHWHNRWDNEVEAGSKFYILENIINEKFMEL